MRNILMKKIKTKRLPKSTNGAKRNKRINFVGYAGQREELKTEARRKGVSVNYLLHMKHFKDWY